MKSKSVLIAAIVAVVAVVGSVSFAAWNLLMKDSKDSNIDIDTRIGISVNYDETTKDTGKLVPSGAILAATNTSKTSLIVGAIKVNFVDSKNAEVGSATHDIKLTVACNAALQYTLKSANAADIVLTNGENVILTIGTTYTVSVSFIAAADAIPEETAAAILNSTVKATFTFEAVEKTAA